MLAVMQDDDEKAGTTQEEPAIRIFGDHGMFL